jgi:hypothetical protein
MERVAFFLSGQHLSNSWFFCKRILLSRTLEIYL